ncbi:MAG: phosphopantetheine-binding protein [Candidatus Sulfotelmatobacter sp.]
METGSLTLTATEELIAGVWSSLLGKSEIGRADNFFDLGGHSLMVIQMLSRLQFADHYAHRPPVRNNVVHGDQQHMLVFGQTGGESFCRNWRLPAGCN